MNRIARRLEALEHRAAAGTLPAPWLVESEAVLVALLAKHGYSPDTNPAEWSTAALVELLEAADAAKAMHTETRQ